MGLDMHLTGNVYHEGRWRSKGETDRRKKISGYPVTSSDLDIAYWRKHPDLHGYIVKHFGEGKDSCQRITLREKDCLQIAEAILKRKLPHTKGFFFGESAWHKKDRIKNAKVFTDTAKWLEKYQKDWTHSVYYQASW